MSERELLTIDTDEEIAKIIRQLHRLPDKIAAPGVLAKAINSAGGRVRRQIVRDAQKRYAIKDDKILKKEEDGAPKFYKATAADLAGVIRSKGPMNDIMAFMTSPNTATGAAAAQVLNSGGMTPLQKGDIKAFVTRFASGHIAIVQRDMDGKYTEPEAIARRLKNQGRKADMTRIKKLVSPAVPHMLGNEEVRAKAETMTYQWLQQEIQKHIKKVLA